MCCELALFAGAAVGGAGGAAPTQRHLAPGPDLPAGEAGVGAEHAVLPLWLAGSAEASGAAGSAGARRAAPERRGQQAQVGCKHVVGGVALRGIPSLRLYLMWLYAESWSA